jgi:hypothetical protein
MTAYAKEIAVHTSLADREESLLLAVDELYKQGTGKVREILYRGEFNSTHIWLVVGDE